MFAFLLVCFNLLYHEQVSMSRAAYTNTHGPWEGMIQLHHQVYACGLVCSPTELSHSPSICRQEKDILNFHVACGITLSHGITFPFKPYTVH